MIRFKAFTGVLLIVLVIAAAWYGVLLYQERQSAGLQLASMGTERHPAFRFPDLEGIEIESSEWQGKILVINFWATWCPPCRKEMPLFIEMQDQFAANGVQFIGIAIDDFELVQDFHDVYGINFPTLIGNMEAVALANTLGNRFDSLPFTAIIDRQGNNRYVQAGEMDKGTLIRQLNHLIK